MELQETLLAIAVCRAQGLYKQGDIPYAGICRAGTFMSCEGHASIDEFGDTNQVMLPRESLHCLLPLESIPTSPELPEPEAL